MARTSRQYLRVEWLHSLVDEPVTLFMELDQERWEVRKVEVYRDGTMSFANGSRSSGTSKLSIEPIPAIAEIASDQQFIPETISPEEFEAVWSLATT